jgi:hypothetical protein
LIQSSSDLDSADTVNLNRELKSVSQTKNIVGRAPDVIALSAVENCRQLLEIAASDRDNLFRCSCADVVVMSPKICHSCHCACLNYNLPIFVFETNSNLTISFMKFRVKSKTIPSPHITEQGQKDASSVEL